MSNDNELDVPKSQELSTNDLPDHVKEAIAKSNQEIASTEEVTVPYISLKGNKFSMGDNRLGTTLDVVVLAASYDYSYYDWPYDPDNPHPPACFAVGMDGKELTPHHTSPQPQSDVCAVCHNNMFGSAANGKGKACKNSRRLVLAGLANGRVLFDELAILRLPPTSIKSWSSYSKMLATRVKRPYWSVVTTLKIDDNSDFAKVISGLNTEITLNSDDLAAIADNLDAYVEMATSPYDVSQYEPYEPSEPGKKKSKMS